MNKSIKQLCILAAAVGAVSIGSVAQAQYRVNTGRVNDANNRAGSGGLNGGSDGGNGRSPYAGVTGNDIVTGNVTAGKEFRGNVPYTDPRAFRGTLSSNPSDRFVRGSAGTPYTGEGGVMSNAQTARPFYGDARGVAPPAGFVRDGFGSTGYVPGPAPTRSGSDLRLGNTLDNDTVILPQPGQLVLPGPVDPSTDKSTLISASALYGVRRWDPNAAEQQVGSRYANVFGDVNARATISEMQINAMRQELMQAAGANSAMLDNQRQDQQQQQPLNPDGTQAPATDGNLAQPLGAPVGSPNNSSLPGAPLQSSLTPANPAAGDLTTGEGMQSRLVVPAAQQSAANATLQARLEKNGEAKMTDVDRARQYNKDLMARNAKQGQQPMPGPAGQPGVGQPGTGQPGTTPPVAPAPSDSAVPAPTNASGQREAPPQIKSFSEGVKAKSMAETLKKAEDLMKDGKWFNAAEQYDIALQVAPNNMLYVVGRANAELGGSYYGKAEADLRRAFTQDPATLEGTYDLHSMIGDERLQFLVNDLKDIANKNSSQARPMFLLAYIAYNTDNARMAAGYLDVAEKRAGANDTFYSLMRKHWVLPKGDAPAPDLNKP